MKTLGLIFLCLTLNTAVVWSAEIHYVQADLHVGTNGNTVGNCVYVLLIPFKDGTIAPRAYETFDTTELESYIEFLLTNGNISSGTILRFDPLPLRPIGQPPSEQVESLEHCCKRLGITFVITNTA